MKTLKFLAVALFALVVIGEYYRVSGVTRADQDLYKTADGLWIVTQYCYHYGYNETAILRWDGPQGQNRITWDTESCIVKNVLKK